MRFRPDYWDKLDRKVLKCSSPEMEHTAIIITTTGRGIYVTLNAPLTIIPSLGLTAKKYHGVYAPTCFYFYRVYNKD